MIHYFLYFFVFFINSQFALAIVNIESLREAKKKEDPFQGSFVFNIRKTSGNTEKLFFGMKSHLLLKGKNFEDLLFFEHRLGKSKKIKDMNKSLIHFRHTHFSLSPISLEGYGQLQTNEFTRLKLRALLGGGLRGKLFNRLTKNDQFQRAYLGIGVFYFKEYREKLKNSSLNDLDAQVKKEKEKETALRLSTYLSFNIPLNSLLSLKTIFYFQPKIGSFKDYHILEEASLETKITRFLSFVLTQSFSFDSRALKNVKKQDNYFNSSLKLTF